MILEVFVHILFKYEVLPKTFVLQLFVCYAKNAHDSCQFRREQQFFYCLKMLILFSSQ